jgi:hypothetical protein
MACGDRTCYRGTIDDYNMQYKDGPCKAVNCQWEGPTRPHFTDNPARLVYKGDGRWVFEWH